jgi:glycosyltransferase involved in cell wall biosynthesis
VSEATRRALLEFQLVASERITVIPNGVHPSCSPQASTKDDEFSQLTNAEAGALILLSVGSTLARKRLDVLLRVFAAVRSRQAGALLVRIGGLTPEQHQLARELNIFDSIRILPFLDRNLLAAAYRSAAVLLQTSEAEGFGLPVIEAMACGCPVVASDIEVLREVGASAAEYCQVGDIAAWSATVLRLLEERSERPSAWALRRQCGLERAEKFSWAENARQTVDIYRRIHKIGDR